MRNQSRIRDFLLLCLAGMAGLVWTPAVAAPRTQSGDVRPLTDRNQRGVEYSVPKETILRVTLGQPLRMSRLQSGSELDGGLARPLYVGDREVLPAGSHIHLVVEAVQKERVQEKWGVAERLDSIRKLGLNRKYDYHVTFRSASLTLPTGASVPMQVTFVQAGNLVRVEARGREAVVFDRPLTVPAENQKPASK